MCYYIHCGPKNVPFLILLQLLQSLTNFYNIWPTVPGVSKKVAPKPFCKQKLVDICGYELPTILQNFTQKDSTEVKILLKNLEGGGYFFSNTLYTELICNTIIDLPTSPTVLLLHYIGKQVNCILVTLATSYILPLHKLKNIQFIHTVSMYGLHLSLNITASIQK